MATFTGVTTGNYTLTETTPPPGFIVNPTIYQVVVDENGVAFIDGVPVTPTGFVVTNLPITGVLNIRLLDFVSEEPLSSGVFNLEGSGLSPQVTRAFGLATFEPIPIGTYTLRQIAAPPFYLEDRTPRTVVVLDTGEVTVDGNLAPMEGFQIFNVQRT